MSDLSNMENFLNTPRTQMHFGSKSQLVLCLEPDNIIALLREEFRNAG